VQVARSLKKGGTAAQRETVSNVDGTGANCERQNSLLAIATTRRDRSDTSAPELTGMDTSPADEAFGRWRAAKLD
jgi:hypothetical protein